MTCDYQGGDPPILPSEKIVLIWLFTESNLGDLFCSPLPQVYLMTNEKKLEVESLVLRGKNKEAFVIPQMRNEDQIFYYLLMWSPVWMTLKGRRVSSI